MSQPKFIVYAVIFNTIRTASNGQGNGDNRRREGSIEQIGQITLNPPFRKRDCSDTVPDEYPLPYPNRILYFYYPYLDRNFFQSFRVQGSN